MVLKTNDTTTGTLIKILVYWGKKVSDEHLHKDMGL
jgi:hypothetical protein